MNTLLDPCITKLTPRKNGIPPLDHLQPLHNHLPPIPLHARGRGIAQIATLQLVVVAVLVICVPIAAAATAVTRVSVRIASHMAAWVPMSVSMSEAGGKIKARSAADAVAVVDRVAAAVVELRRDGSRVGVELLPAGGGGAAVGGVDVQRAVAVRRVGEVGAGRSASDVALG